MDAQKNFLATSKQSSILNVINLCVNGNVQNQSNLQFFSYNLKTLHSGGNCALLSIQKKYTHFSKKKSILIGCKI